MERSWATMLMIGEVVGAGTLMLLLPRVTRRGLLFGVYVGEEAWGEDQASNVVRRYTLGGVAWMAVCLTTGVGLGLLARVIARAKHAIRYPAAAISAEAQARFRLAMTRFLAVVALVTCALLTNLSVGVTNVAAGIRPTLRWTWAFLGLALATSFGGLIFLTLRYGQGGALLERGAGMAPLTNGLADNRYWVLGYFYVNHEDPAILIEARFGLGYTLNLGNWKAVVALIALFGLMMTSVVAPLVGG